MSSKPIKTPGVYIDEIDAFPNSVVPVATSVPAFIGYTPQADYNGKSYHNTPTKITSFAEFRAIFGLPDTDTLTSQYTPQYYLVKENDKPEQGDFVSVNGQYYSIVPDPNTIYYLYNSIKWFYQNGGGDAYIVSVGTYGEPSAKPIKPGDQIINTNVKLNDLMEGLALLKKETEPTMYICPEATLLSVDNNATLMQEMLHQNTEVQNAISIFDIIGARRPDPVDFMSGIETFRANTGTNGLKYGAAYYPFVGTDMLSDDNISYLNLFGGDLKQLESIISPEDNPNANFRTVLSLMENKTLTFSQGNKELKRASRDYADIMDYVCADANLLPPSGAIAGVMTSVDNHQGVWKAPANVGIMGSTSLSVSISDNQQADLNIDPVAGKSINAIRAFRGAGILVWGARTLDGNSQDWRYISTRRTITFIEQSCKLAIAAYAFEANTKNTWTSVTAMIDSFLRNLWKQGGLAGATPSEAYSVECGLGSTMTSEDVLNGIMNVSIKLAIIRPAEFIIIQLQQQMANS